MKKNSGYFPLIVASLITGLTMFALYFLSGNELFLSIIPPLIYIVPGLSYGLGLLFVFSKNKLEVKNYKLKALLLIIFSVFGYIAAFVVTQLASIIPFLGSLIGCFLGSIILAYGLEFSFGKMSKNKFRTIIWLGGILGAILCIPTSIAVKNSFMSTNPSNMYYIFPVVAWQFIMSFLIINILDSADKEKINQPTINQQYEKTI